MRAWNDRPTEVAALFNPAFSALLIREGILGFTGQNPNGMPYPLVFILLPIVLHKATRLALPKSVATKMHPWIQQNQEARIGFSDRCVGIREYTREAILFASASGLVTFSNDATLHAPRQRLKRLSWPTDSESAICRERARFVGRWRRYRRHPSRTSAWSRG